MASSRPLMLVPGADFHRPSEQLPAPRSRDGLARLVPSRRQVACCIASVSLLLSLCLVSLAVVIGQVQDSHLLWTTGLREQDARAPDRQRTEHLGWRVRLWINPINKWLSGGVYAPWDPSFSEGQKLVKKGYKCMGPDESMGHWIYVDSCAASVKQSGGKYFNYGVGFRSGGWCYLVYSTTEDCHPGYFKLDDDYDFYSIPQVDSNDTKFCKTDQVALATNPPNNNQAYFAQHVLNRTQYTITESGPIQVAERSGKRYTWFFRKKFCHEKYFVTCPSTQQHSGAADIQSEISCCHLGWFGTSCVPDKATARNVTVHTRALYKTWETPSVCHDVGDTAFSAMSDTRPAYQGPGPGQCMQIRTAGKSVPVSEMFLICPLWAKNVFAAFMMLEHAVYRKLFKNGFGFANPILMLFQGSQNSKLDPYVFDAYSRWATVAILHFNLRWLSGGAHYPPEDRIAIPSKQQFMSRFIVYVLNGPSADEIDIWGYRPGMFFESLFNGKASVALWQIQEILYAGGEPIHHALFFDSVVRLPFSDGICNSTFDPDGGDDCGNRWEPLLGHLPDFTPACPYHMRTCNKKEFAQGLWADYRTPDGDPAYPQEIINFRLNFFNPKTMLWLDSGDRFCAFENIGIQRVTLTNDAQRALVPNAKYIIVTMGLKTLQHRPFFGKMGADMYFDQDGWPIAVILPSENKTADGKEVPWVVLRDSADPKTWQYAKWCWRSSLFLFETLVDHLWATHFANANTLTAATREGLPPAHPLRRMLTMFTYGTVKVNKQAVHQLVGPWHTLQRSSPFADFWEVANLARDSVLPLKTDFDAFTSNLSSKDPYLREMPLYKDGVLLYNALFKFISDYVELYRDQWCSGELISDPAIYDFFHRYQAWSLRVHHESTDLPWLGLIDKGVPTGFGLDPKMYCEGLKKALAVMTFSVTGWHRHVGTVADNAIDPDWSSFSWVKGEAFARPRQHQSMMLISGSTAALFPKIIRNYGFVTQGMGNEEAQASKLFDQLQDSMKVIKTEVDKRNAERHIPYYQMDPSYVECSLAV